MAEEKEINQTQIQTPDQELNQDENENVCQEEEKFDFKKLVHFRFIISGIQDTLKPRYVFYKLGSSRYFVAVSKQGRIVVYDRLAFMVTSRRNIAVDILPGMFLEPGGPVVEYIELSDVKEDYSNSEYDIVSVNYMRNHNKQTIVIPEDLMQMLQNILGNVSVIILDSLINYTRF